MLRKVKILRLSWKKVEKEGGNGHVKTVSYKGRRPIREIGSVGG